MFNTMQVATALISRAVRLPAPAKHELSILAQLLKRPALVSRSAAQWRALRYPAHAGHPLCADLVNLRAGLDTVAVGPDLIDLTEEEVGAIKNSIQAFVSESDWVIELGGTGQGLIFSDQMLGGHDQPAHSLSGKNLRDAKGLQGALQTLDSELQMLLFEHPVNQRRVERGQAPVGGLWFWDSMPDSSPAASLASDLPVLFAKDATLVAAWEANGGVVFDEADADRLQAPNWVLALDSISNNEAAYSILQGGTVKRCFFVDQTGSLAELRSPPFWRRLLKRFSA